MSIQIIDNFELSLAKPIDNRFVVGSLSFYTNKDSIPLKYNGLRIYDTTDSTPYIWTGATWSYDIDRISIKLENTSSSIHYIPFVGATSGVNYVKVSDKGLRYNPYYSQVLLADGSNTRPTLSFSSSNTLGIYKVNLTTIGFASSGVKRFEISSTSATSSVKFNVNAISGSASPAFRVTSYPADGSGGYKTGVMSIGYIPTASNFEFFPFNNTSSFAIATLSPTHSSPSASNTIAGTRITFINWPDSSSYQVRDIHYFNTETTKGFISMGNYGNNYQFQFHMNGRTAVLGGGGLVIGSNLLVGGAASIGATLSVGGAASIGATFSMYGDTYINSKFLYLRIGDQNHGIGYTSSFGGYTLEGPAVFGFGSGVLGTTYGSKKVALHWNNLGNVGIGTASSSSNDLLTVNGTASVSRIKLGNGSSTSLALSFASQLSTGFFLSPASPYYGASWISKLGGNIYLTLTEGSISVEGLNPKIIFHQEAEGTILTLDTARGYTNPTTGLVSLQLTDIGTGLYSPSMGELAISVYDDNLGIGVEKLKFAVNDIYADIHNKGTYGIGDSGNTTFAPDGLGGGTGAWLNPSIASGTFTSIISNPSNLTSLSLIGPVSWMRVGNVVSVSGQVEFNVTISSSASTFYMTLPIKSYFGTYDNSPLNGVGKIVGKSSGGDVAAIRADNSYVKDVAEFLFNPSTTGSQVMCFSYQYSVGTLLD